MSETVYAIGDIHGRLDLLKKAFALIDEDADGLANHIVCLGDYVDRGPDSKAVLDFLIAAKATRKLTCLKGNHEEMFLDALRRGAKNFGLGDLGGEETLRSYGEQPVPYKHVEFLSMLPHWLDEAGRIFVHAGFWPAPYSSLAKQDSDSMLWIRDRFFDNPEGFAGWPHIVHGHTPEHAGKPDPSEPELLDWRTNLDTKAYRTGILTIGVFEGEGGPPSRVLRARQSA